MKKLLLALFIISPLLAGEKPNILWIVSEDNSSYWIGCYGNEQAKTPNIDALAKDGILFENAYSNAPVCAVARATLLMGAYSPTMGTQHMRSRHPIQEKFRPYPEYLRDAGYHCTNPGKTDYNFEGNDKSYWDKGDYKKRPDGKPFFAVFNFTESHESSLFENKPGEPKRLKPEEINLPPYLPDLPEIRKDMARYHDRITDMDTRVGKVLEDLEEAGLADDTIVFYYADHGGILPRGKRYLEQTGVKVPLIIRVPEKFRHLAPFKPGDRVTEPVSFVDFAPTLLSLASLDEPEQMQGRPFLGDKRVEPAADEMEFLFADRFDELYGMRRGLTDGKWKYIRNFNPDRPTAPYSFYQFGQPGWVAYEKAWKDGKLSGIHKALWEAPGTSEQLYDLSADPWEINNLAADPTHAEKLAALRERLKSTMKDINDTGLIPEPMFNALSGNSTIADYVQSDKFEVSKITDLAFEATEVNPDKLPRFKEAITSEDPVERYWGVVGIRLLGDKAAAESIAHLLKDPVPVIRTTAAEALISSGMSSIGSAALLADISSDMDDNSLLNLLNTLRRHDLLDQLPKGWAKGISTKGGKHDYIERFSQKIPAE
ncbi:MAG: sulfatase-like hydrolase/transferase [Akkermansiaceae bacterium]|jgi:N-sulfoglucosamine sulfohydrolase|nr:sulfatase-like hydrolase/transferase [Akkermansiaceae bacterium]MDP4648037.1 sulfatase-like hydrolase/transferase [Akkermansiaceae bacterium]MDP4720310.1 sulfatase-like hydrolase/transferase [Akkermansiaceae bacterium]MDP4781385.1 sulfatase-like hydrolase/transferase [Akkermansiaceae bacterium]MDP4848704.1 sulfatase-like hydrolase/transferase [Akkermansiaceae bacterium]